MPVEIDHQQKPKKSPIVTLICIMGKPAKEDNHQLLTSSAARKVFNANEKENSIYQVKWKVHTCSRLKKRGPDDIKRRGTHRARSKPRLSAPGMSLFIHLITTFVLFSVSFTTASATSSTSSQRQPCC